jgi:hypothetical protein
MLGRWFHGKLDVIGLFHTFTHNTSVATRITQKFQAGTLICAYYHGKELVSIETDSLNACSEKDGIRVLTSSADPKIFRKINATGRMLETVKSRDFWLRLPRGWRIWVGAENLEEFVKCLK